MKVRAQQGENIPRETYREPASVVPHEHACPRLPQRFVAKQRIASLSYRRAFVGGTVEDEERFLAKIGERLGSQTMTIPIGRARSGIYLLARLSIHERRRKVLMSPFTIPDIATMVVLAGGDPVFYDFEPDTTSCSLQSINALIDEETACVIVTHYHVNEVRIAEVAAICRAHGVYLFDDCALTFGGKIDSQPVGTVTDASVFSFSAYKLVNYFWGGLVSTRNPAIGQRIAEIVGTWPRLELGGYANPALSCLSYDIASRPGLFNRLTFPLVQLRAKNSSATRSLEPIRVETVELNPTLTSRPSLAAFAEWTPKLDKIDELLARRRKIAGIYRKHLGRAMVGAATPASVIDGSCFVNFPVLVPAERRDEIARKMILAGYDVGHSLYPNVHRHPKYVAVSGYSDNIDNLVASTIYLPVHFGVSECYAEAIAQRLAEAVRCQQ